MYNVESSGDINKILSLSEEELNKIFKEMTLEEIEDLLEKISEGTENE